MLQTVHHFERVGDIRYIGKGVQNAIEEDFMTPGSVDMFFVTSDPVKALEYIENYVPEEFDILKLRKIRSEAEK